MLLTASTLVSVRAMANRPGVRKGPGGMLGSIERGVDQLQLTPETRKAR